MRKGEIACHNVFRQLYTPVSLMRQDAALCGNGLNQLCII